MAYFYIEIEDGAPVSFEVRCEFMGPIVRCLTPIIDYSLVKVNSQESMTITVENQSPIPAKVLFKKSGNELLNFQNMLSHSQARMSQNFNKGMVPYVYDQPFRTSNGNQITLDTCHLSL